MKTHKYGFWHKIASLITGMTLAAIPAVVEESANTIIEKACNQIDLKLQEIFKKTVYNSAITLALNIAGVLVAIFVPVNAVFSRWCSGILFLSAFIFFCVRTALYIKNYGKITVSVAKSIITNKSINKGIESYITNSFPYVTRIYTGLDIVSIFVPSLKRIPRLQQTVQIFINTFWKRIVLFISLFLVYTITVFWILKPVLLAKYAGI